MSSTISVPQPGLHDITKFRICCCSPLFTVSVEDSLKAYSKPGQDVLTQQAGLKALKTIQWKSDLLSLLTKPCVLIGIGCILLGGAIALSYVVTAVALTVIALMVLRCTGAFLIGYAIQNGCNGTLKKMSGAYDRRSADAAALINQLQDAGTTARLQLPRATN